MQNSTISSLFLTIHNKCFKNRSLHCYENDYGYKGFEKKQNLKFIKTWRGDNQKIKPQNDSSMHERQKHSSFNIVHLCFAQYLDSHNTQKS
jgi:hypothetical protein